jgi:hypothetical protein
LAWPWRRLSSQHWLTDPLQLLLLQLLVLVLVLVPCTLS